MKKFLKIQAEIKPSFRNKPAKIKPKITLQGNWIEELGFKAFDYVKITTHNGMIVLEPQHDYQPA